MKKLISIFLNIVIISGIATSVFLGTFQSVQGSMSSANYKIEADSVNISGNQSSSASYKIEDTVGEVGTSDSESASYKTRAGYQAMWDYPPYLSFSLDGNYVAFGVLDPYLPSFEETKFTVATNAQNGYVVTIAGDTLTHSNGIETIEAMGATADSSSIGTEQFGINLKDNSNPDVGAEPDGGSGSPYGQYAIKDKFAFHSGDIIASASSFTYPTIFTISYLGNVAIDTEAGWYTTVLTLIATGRY